MIIFEILIFFYSILFVICDNQILYEEIICKFDIRLPGMSNDSLEKAKNCTVIEGKVIISHLVNSLCNQLQFPLLREVTDYVLLAFTSCDTTLDMFPNLMVIRGYELVQGYSLFVYNNAWKHINFGNLRVNLGGNILVSLNPFLCNVGNIDWKYLNDNFYQNNKNVDYVKKVYLKTNRYICPNSCSQTCPESLIDGQKTRLCWSYSVCQSVCSSSCLSKGLYCHVSNPNQCCHKQCLGGCFNNTDRSCVSCRHFVLDGQCIPECPDKYYGFKERRCVLEKDCSLKHMSIIANQRKCVKECPSGLFASVLNNTTYCVNGSSISVKKECGTIFLKSLKDLDSVANCYSAERVIISLQVGGREVSKNLKEVFKNLKIIKQFIRIMRSNYLESLSFLSPLMEIQGNKGIGINNVTLDVTGNNILSKLWEPHPQFKLGAGSVRFLANRNLCKKFIHVFIKKIGLEITKFDGEVIDATNGHVAICTFVPLNLSVSSIKSRYVELTWRNTPTLNSYQILSGLLYYRPMTNVANGAESADVRCSSVMWSVIEAHCKNNETGLILKSASLWPQDNSKDYICILSSLTPATSYQVYVEFRFTRQDSAAVSNKVFIKTSTEMPTQPQQVEAVSLSPHEVRLSWKPPLYPNGVIAKYIIWYRMMENSFENEYMNENYCDSNINSGFKSYGYTKANSEKMIEDLSPKQSACISCNNCKKACDRSPQKQEELLEMAKFDSHISSLILVQRKPKQTASIINHKVKAQVFLDDYHLAIDIPSVSSNFTVIPDVVSNNSLASQTPKSNPIIDNSSASTMKQIELPVTEQRNQFYFTITNLNFFTEYLAEIVACHAPSKIGNYSEEHVMRLTIADCSNRASVSFRTMSNPHADIIPNISDGKVLLLKSLKTGMSMTWKVPQKVNGLILFYMVRYLVVPNEKWTSKCIDSKVPIKTKGLHSNASLNYNYEMKYTMRLHISGTYKFQLMAVTLAGNGSWSNNETIVFNASNSNEFDNILKILLATSIALIFILSITISVSVFLWRKKQRYIITTNNEYFLSGHDEWDIEFSDIKLLIPIGKGNFGIVYSGSLKKLETPAKSIIGNVAFPLKVAVKTVSKAASIEDIAQFLSEACLMKQFLGFHIVHLLGIYSGNIQKENALYPMVVMEMMENGDLSDYLHRFAERSDKGVVDGQQCLLWAIQIADGMCYLSCKRFVHRDLAARNCLVDANLNIKIGDFGLARSTNENYYYRVRGRAKMPVRWMAPESLISAVFTSKTDVWSYGVVLYEISTLGSLPYSGMNHKAVIDFVRDGGRLDLEDLKMPSALLDVMIWCWSYSDNDRPSFMQILEFLVPYANIEFFKQVSFYHNGCSQLDQCGNCSKVDSLVLGENAMQLNTCKHIYKCSCSNSLSMCDICCDQSKTTGESEDILTFSVSDILKQHNQ